MNEITQAEFDAIERARSVQSFEDMLKALRAGGSIVIVDFVPEADGAEADAGDAGDAGDSVELEIVFPEVFVVPAEPVSPDVFADADADADAPADNL